MTTGTAYEIVVEPTSEIDGTYSTEVGEPWEFLAGLDHPQYGDVPHDHPKWNAYVTYVCSWSMLEIETAPGDLDLLYKIVEKKVRDDPTVLIADINCDEIVDIFDQVICSEAFGFRDEGPGPDGVPETPDDKPAADSNFDARADVSDPRGSIDIYDVVRIVTDFGKKLTPECIVT
jgi:hypothetical protein